MDYLKKRLSDAEALGFANDLLKAFGILYNAIPMKLTTSIVGGQQTITRVYQDLDKKKEAEVKTGFVDFKDSDDYHMDNVYELYWRARRFEVTLYSSPEDCGYYSALPNYDDLAYVFCIIQEKRSGSIHSEMCFGFDAEKKTFLELFDIDYHFDKTIYRSEDAIEAKLKGRTIF